MGACSGAATEASGPSRCVGSGVMGSDGFESKKLGGPPSGGTGKTGLDQVNILRGAERDPAMDALSGLGDAAANLVEISGVIKWFDASKGYGFIVPDNGWPDVLLHVTVLRRDGYQTAYEGARLVVECVQRAKGYQAFRIVSMDESTAIHPAQMLPPRTHVSGHPDQRSGAGAGQMVQPAARLRLPDLRRGHARHLRAYGNAAPLRHDRAAPRPVCAGALRARLQGHDGGRDPSRDRAVGAVVALIAARRSDGIVSRTPPAWAAGLWHLPRSSG